MSVEITCREFWTFNYKFPPKGKKLSDRKLPLSHLNEEDCRSILGELQIIIDGRVLPHLGYYSADDVSIGYWTIYLSEMFATFRKNIPSYTLYGGDQGQPDYLFEKENGDIYLSIIASDLGGEKDPNWQRVKINYKEFKNAFIQFKEKLLLEIATHAPDMVSKWNEFFHQSN